MNHIHPSRPFDGQIFIDAHRVKWEYNSETKCWRKIGSVNDLPKASETQTGLLSAKHKAMIDSISEKGGSFGFVVKPLLSVVPQHKNTLLSDKVESSFIVESGSVVIPSNTTNQALEENAYAGKYLQFTTGRLKDNIFLISKNDDRQVYLLGDASLSNTNDKFAIIDPSAFNINGIISGDVQMVSESIDISCIDQNDNEITASNCSKFSQDTPTPPALDFKVSELFKSTFCIQQPGCEGPRGEKGNKGKSGKDGTGDGPKGKTGEAGADAPSEPFTFSGIKVIDIDDVYDTAVVGIEINPTTSKVNVVKAKMKVPDNDVPADQVIATEVFRAVDFTGNDWEYTLEMPANDPIGSKDALVAYYPQGLFSKSNFTDTSTVVSTMKLSEFIKEVTNYWQTELDRINSEYDQQIKAFIDAKDAEARKVLASLCQQQAECEWERPIEMCIGIKPNECNPLNFTGTSQTETINKAKGNSGAGGGGALNFMPPKLESEESEESIIYGFQLGTPKGNFPVNDPFWANGGNVPPPSPSSE